MTIKSILIYASGKGSNLINLVDKQKNYIVVGCISDNKNPEFADFLKQKNIPLYIFSREEFKSVAEQKNALFKKASELNPDIHVLAGFMKIVPAQFAASHKVINIHPSLLPKFPGLNTHQRAIDAGETEHGCTVHWVDAGIDTGTVIASEKVFIEPGETAASLQGKVQIKEHILYPKILNSI